MEEIYNLNKSIISNPNLIYSGQVLTLQSQATASNNQVQIAPLEGELPNIPSVSQSVTSAVVPTPTPVQNVVTSSNKPASGSVPVGQAAYASMINAAAAMYGVSPDLMNHIINCESGYNPLAYNPSGATGIAQFMPGTFNGSWNPYRGEGIWSAHAQIYAMALKISLGGVSAWVCSRL